LKQINSGSLEPELMVSPVRLVVRESCGAPKFSLERKLA